MHDARHGRNHLTPPKVFGVETPLYELFHHQHEFLGELTNILAKTLPENDAQDVLAILSLYQAKVDHTLQQRELNIFNGRGEHGLMEARIRQKTLEDSGYQDVVFPYPEKEDSYYPLLEGLLRDLVIPNSQELLFSQARQPLPDDLTKSPRGIFGAKPGSMSIILRPKGHVVHFVINHKSHIAPIVLEKTTYGNEVFMRKNVEEMIIDLFELFGQYDCLRSSTKVIEASPVIRDTFVSTLRLNLPGFFGGEDEYVHPVAFKGLCFKPFSSLDEARQALKDSPVQLRMCFRPDCCSDGVVLLLKIDETSFLSVDSSLDTSVHYYSDKETSWVTVKDYLPYVPSDYFFEVMDTFFKSHGHEPTYSFQSSIEKP